MVKKDPYQILEIDKNATQEKIKKSYQELVIKWNPDKFRTGSKCEESSCGLEKVDQGEKFCSPLCKTTYEEYEIKMKKINDAYEVLSDPKKRKEHDERDLHESIRNNNNTNSSHLKDNNNDKNLKTIACWGGGIAVVILIICVAT